MVKFGKKLGRKLLNTLKNSVANVAEDIVPGSSDATTEISKLIESKVRKSIKNKKKRDKKKERMMTGSGSYSDGRVVYGGSGAYSSRNLRQKTVYQGSGAYITNNLIGKPVPPMNIGSFLDETGSIVIERREYISDIFVPSTPGAFTITAYSINPGLVAVFPWLSQLATNYDEYIFEKIIFSYRSVVADSVSTGAMGTVMIAAQYNAANAVFSTKNQMMEYSGSISGRICDSIDYGFECDPRKGSNGVLNIRYGAVPTGQDVKTYDLGVLNIATNGIQSGNFAAGTQIGELWCEYKVRLGKPKLFDQLGMSIPFDEFYFTTGVAANVPFGTDTYRATNNSLGGYITTGSDRYTFPDQFAGDCFVYYGITSSGVITNSDITPSGNIVASNDFIAAGVATHSINVFGGTANASRISAFVITPASTAGGNYLTFGLTGTTPSGTWVMVTQHNPSAPHVVGGYAKV